MMVVERKLEVRCDQVTEELKVGDDISDNQGFENSMPTDWNLWANCQNKPANLLDVLLSPFTLLSHWGLFYCIWNKLNWITSTEKFTQKLATWKSPKLVTWCGLVDVVYPPLKVCISTTSVFIIKITYIVQTGLPTLPPASARNKRPRFPSGKIAWILFEFLK